MNIEKPNRDFVLGGIPPEPKRNNNPGLLAPGFWALVQKAQKAVLDATGHEVYLFEGFRSGERQRWLWGSSRTYPGPWLTNARAGQSAHEYGLGADLVAKVDGQWSWDEDKIPYAQFVEIYKGVGLASAAPREQVHVEWIAPFEAKELADFVRLHGLPALWARVFPKTV